MFFSIASARLKRERVMRSRDAPRAGGATDEEKAKITRRKKHLFFSYLQNKKSKKTKKD